MKIQKDFDLRATELMGALKQELMDRCITRGDSGYYADFSEEEEKAVLALYSVFRPLAEQVRWSRELRMEIKCIEQKVED